MALLLLYNAEEKRLGGFVVCLLCQKNVLFIVS